MKLPFSSRLTIVRFTVLVVFVVSAFILDSRFSILTFLAFAVFLGCAFVAMRKARKQFDLRGLKRLRDIFPRNDGR